MLPALVWSVSSAHYASLLKSKETELAMMSYVLLSAFEINNNVIDMPAVVYDERLNIPQSGYQGYIKLNDSLVWQSASTLEPIPSRSLPVASVGESRFIVNTEKSLFLYTFTAEFTSENQYIPIQFSVVNHMRDVAAEHAVFTRSLWQYGALLTSVVALLLLLILLSVIKPLQHLMAQLQQAENGKIRALTGHYPKELAQAKISINNLLENEDFQKKRLQNLGQDLAHSLKTPLSVMQNQPHLSPELQQEIQTIEQIIQRQLNRPALGQNAWVEQIDILPILSKTMQSLQKIYPPIVFTLDQDITPSQSHNVLELPIEQTDAYELFGNLIDNAAKAARSKVMVQITREDKRLIVAVHDDGTGIPTAQRKNILERGQRLDTYTSGQGIGMAMVSDITDLYHATLQITESDFGGAKVAVIFTYQ